MANSTENKITINQITIDRDLAIFCRAYLMGNEAAAAGQVGAYQIAYDCGFDKGTREYDAAVSGAAAFFFHGHTFEVKAASITI